MSDYSRENEKKVTRFTRTVFSTPEFTELQRSSLHAGARITGTKAMPDGKGITVYLEIDGNKRQF